ncbi:phosphoribosylformylglycinamidine synthase subunit PurS, partial [Staphylococcus epidermidis]
GKVLYMRVNEGSEEGVDNIIRRVSEKLFGNRVIEEYRYKVMDEKEKG